MDLSVFAFGFNVAICVVLLVIVMRLRSEVLELRAAAGKANGYLWVIKENTKRRSS